MPVIASTGAMLVIGHEAPVRFRPKLAEPNPASDSQKRGNSRQVSGASDASKMQSRLVRRRSHSRNFGTAATAVRRAKFHGGQGLRSEARSPWSKVRTSIARGPRSCLSFQFRRNKKFLRRRIVVHTQYIGLAADLAIFNITLPPSRRFVHGSRVPLSARSALESGFQGGESIPQCVGTGICRQLESHLGTFRLNGYARSPAHRPRRTVRCFSAWLSSRGSPGRRAEA